MTRHGDSRAASSSKARSAQESIRPASLPGKAAPIRAALASIEPVPSGIGCDGRRPDRRGQCGVAVRVSAEEVAGPGPDDRQPLVGRDDLRAHGVEPAVDRDDPAFLEELEVAPGDPAGGLLRVTGRDRMADGPVHVAALREPLRRPTVQLRHPVGGATTQLDPEQLGKQAVVAVPLAPLVERRDEHIGPLDLRESSGRVRPVGQRVGERPADRVHDRRSRA